MIRRPRRTLLLAALALACATSKPAAPQPAKAAPAPAAAAPSAAAPAAPSAAAPAAPSGPDRSHVPPLGPAPELRLPPQRHLVLSNGLKVRLVEHHQLPIVALHLVVDAGASRDPAKLPGVASFTAAMLTEGTKTRSATRISDEVGFLGASLGAGASPDAAFLSGSTLSKHLPKLLELLADVAMNPAFPGKDFARVQDQRKVALLQQRDQPVVVASKAFIDTFWAGTPYGHFSLGTEASVAGTTPAALAAFHRTFWRPANAELVVVGDVTAETLVPALEKTLGRWPKGTAPAKLAAAAPAAPHRTVLIEKPDAPQSFFLLGAPGIDRASPDFVTATVAFQVLGGGLASRLFRNLREDKGYTYGVDAAADARRLAGASVVQGSVKADVTGPALKELLFELGRMRAEPVPPAELEDAKNALVLSLPSDFASVQGIAGRVAALVIYGLPDEYWNGYADAVARVTAADVSRVSTEVLGPSRLTLVVVGVPDVVKPQLDGLALGPVEVRPPPGTPPPAKGAPAAAPARGAPPPRAAAGAR
jgi:zinc protease